MRGKAGEGRAGQGGGVAPNFLARFGGIEAPDCRSRGGLKSVSDGTKSSLQARNIFIELGGLEGYEQLGVISICD